MGRILLGNNLRLMAEAGIAGITIEWLGWDGSVWNLTSGEQGVALQPGFQGFSMPSIQRYEREGPAVHGSYYQGFRVETRRIFLPLLVLSESGKQNFWTSLDSSFFRTLRPDKTGTLRVTDPAGQRREITCRFEGDEEHAYQEDPTQDGVAVYALRLVANEPFWRGEPVSKPFGQSTPEGYYERTNPGEVYFLSSGSSFASAQFANPGDVDSYITWTINGPFETVAVGINGQDIKIGFPITSAQTITIDTSPLDMRVMRNGVNITSLLTTPPRYDVLPAETNTKITIAATGTEFGTVTASLTPLYYRAW